MESIKRELCGISGGFQRRRLLGLAVLGGSIGALLGMKVFHHKTRKAKFFVGVPVILVIEVIVGFLVIVSVNR